MAVKIVTAEGLEYIFNPSFRVDGMPLDRDIPTVTIGGRDGDVVHPDAIRLNSRTLSVAGHIYGASPADADRALDEMNAIIAPGEEVKLYRDETDTKFIKVRFQGNAHSYVQGTNRVVAVCRMNFVAHDPYFYEPMTQAAISISASKASWNVYCNGNVQWQQPIIQMKARAGSVQGPSINNIAAGTKRLHFPGIIAEGRSLVINCEKRLAFITDGELGYYLAKWGLGSYDGAAPTLEEHVTANMDTSWLMYGWPLRVGENNLIYTDDVASSHNVDVAIVWMPRYY